MSDRILPNRNARSRASNFRAPLVVICCGALAVFALTAAVAPGRLWSQARGDGGIETSPAAARALEAKIQLLTGSTPAGPGSFQPIVITDLEANSYLKVHGVEFLPPGVTEPEVHIHSDHVSGAAEVDFNQLNQPAAKTDDWGASLLGMILKGKQRVSANGKVESVGGQGKVTVEKVQLGTTEVPDWLVSVLLENYVQKRYKLDLTKPLAFPDHVTRVELGDGHATFFRSADKVRH